jgi:hypothetical protein
MGKIKETRANASDIGVRITGMCEGGDGKIVVAAGWHLTFRWKIWQHLEMSMIYNS